MRYIRAIAKEHRRVLDYTWPFIIALMLLYFFFESTLSFSADGVFSRASRIERQSQREQCKNSSETFTTDGATDPCAEFNINFIAATRQVVSASVHAATAVTCYVVAASKPALLGEKDSSPCTISDKSSKAFDFASGIVIRDKNEEITSALGGALNHNIGGSTLAYLNKAKLKNKDKAVTNISGENNNTESDEHDDMFGSRNDSDNENSQKSENSTLRLAISNTITSTSTSMGYKNSLEAASNAIDKKAELKSEENVSEISSDSTASAESEKASSNSSADAKSSLANDVLESAITAGYLNQPAFAEYERLTNQSAKNLVLQVAKGDVSPSELIMRSAQPHIDAGKFSEIASLNASLKNKIDELASEQAKDLEPKKSYAFESHSKKPNSNNEDDPLGSIKGMLSTLMDRTAPKTNAEKQNKDSKSMDVGFRSLASKTSETGIYLKNISIFEAISNRYSNIQTSFLNSDSEDGLKSKNIPSNVYLRGK